MFHTQPDTDPDIVITPELIPLSVLRLELPDLDTARLAGREDVDVVTDSIGRLAISLDAARMLLAERAAAEERRAELLRRADEQAVEYDRQYRARIGAGITPDAYAGMSYAEAALSAQLDGLGYAPRASVVADVFDNPAGTMVFHPTISRPDE